MYRKYRPAEFNEVVGQEHVTKTLQAAIKKGVVSHAYLFAGPRGTGKTTVARNLARGVNKLMGDQELSSYLDVIEIDAASNRGIDEIRALRDTIATAPAQLDYKVYIIDEAHMLTREAFNALLKTLEEPPSHVIFILATTEAHKLPETIVSRTQRYDFRPIGQAGMLTRLREIAQAESIKISQDGLEAIAAFSHGGFRDAIGLLDQLSVMDEEITAEQVGQFLGRVTEADLKKLLLSLQAGDANGGLEQLKAILAGGYDGLVVTQQLLDLLRLQLLQASQQDNKVNLAFTRTAIEALAQALVGFKITTHPSLPLELAIVEIALGPLEARPVDDQAQSANTSQATTKSSSPATDPQKSKPSAPTKNNPEAERLCTKALSLIKQHNNSLYAVLRSAKYHMDGDNFVVTCRFSFHKERIEEPRNKALIEKAMTKAFGRPIELQCKLEDTSMSNVEPDSKDSELISSAMAILGGELVDGE
ncbi:DNA polymerase III subunit gamma/tau [Candidatus Saccharibacteria bacterium]|nr:DNA polymerase III subunit gamma/tau [Candidatus Saccharibacteria bacterium]